MSGVIIADVVPDILFAASLQGICTREGGRLFCCTHVQCSIHLQRTDANRTHRNVNDGDAESECERPNSR
eukprot:2690012-Amphidinium_carterae.1